jgi:hypothetical protein
MAVALLAAFDGNAAVHRDHNSKSEDRLQSVVAASFSIFDFRISAIDNRKSAIRGGI